MRGEQTQLGWGKETTWGTAATVDQWFGEAFDDAHVPDENFGKNKDPIRYVGAAGDRNVSKFIDTNSEFTGTITFNVQKPFIWWLGMGTVTSTGSPSTPVTHTMTESGGNYLPSFTLEDWQGSGTDMNVKRVYEGCTIDSMTLRCSEGEKVENEISYIAETMTPSSGTKSTITAMSGNTFRWEHCQLNISGAGIDGMFESLKEWSWTLNNNLDAKRYQKNTGNISQPIPGDRDYEFTLTVDAPVGSAALWYDTYKKNGSPFELNLYMFRTSGTDDVKINMSGCRAIDIDQPIKSKGVPEQVWTVKPTKCEIVVRDSTMVNGVDAYLGS